MRCASACYFRCHSSRDEPGPLCVRRHGGQQGGGNGAYDGEGRARVFRPGQEVQGDPSRAAVLAEHDWLDQTRGGRAERDHVRRKGPAQRLGPFVATLEATLEANAKKPKRERLT